MVGARARLLRNGFPRLMRSEEGRVVQNVSPSIAPKRNFLTVQMRVKLN